MDFGDGDEVLKSSVSEYGHVAYQIKGNKTYNNIHENILPLHTSLSPGVSSKGEFFF